MFSGCKNASSRSGVGQGMGFGSGALVLCGREVDDWGASSALRLLQSRAPSCGAEPSAPHSLPASCGGLVDPREGPFRGAESLPFLGPCCHKSSRGSILVAVGVRGSGRPGCPASRAVQTLPRTPEGRL